MRHEALAEIRSWFARYVCSFAPEGEAIHPLLELKRQHIERVAAGAGP